MGLLDLFRSGTDEVSVYSKKVDHYSMVYFPEKVYSGDEVDINCISDLYTKLVVFDGINVDNNMVNLRFSTVLEDENGNMWGNANVNMCLAPTFVDNKKLRLSKKDNISYKQIFISDTCRLTMTSMFLKSSENYYFYARTTKGLYCCINLRYTDYLLMEYVRYRFQNRYKVNSGTSVNIIKYGNITPAKLVRFNPDPVEVIKYDVKNGDLLRILVSVDNVYCLCYCDIPRRDATYFYRNSDPELEKYLDELQSKNTVYILRNQIECGFMHNGRSNIIENIVFLAKVSSFVTDEVLETKAIVFYKQAYNKLIETLTDYIKNVKSV